MNFTEQTKTATFDANIGGQSDFDVKFPTKKLVIEDDGNLTSIIIANNSASSTSISPNISSD